MKMVKKMIVFLCILLTAQGIVWAGGDNQAASTNANQQSTIRFAWWGGQSRTDVTMKVVEMFKQQNPGVEFECTYMSFADYWNNLSTQVAAGVIPDILQMDYRYIVPWAEKNLLAPLDGYWEKKSTWIILTKSTLKAV